MAFLWANLPALSNAQQVDTETGNVVYTTVNPAPSSAQGAYTWGGFVVTPSTGGGLSGGNVPGYNTSTGTFMFGYSPGTISYGIAVNAALQAAGTGIQVNGFRYSWNYFNQDFSRGTLAGNISLTNSAGAVVESYNYNLPKTTNGWTTMSGIQNFNNQYALPSLGGLGVSFSGKDDRFWAGYYGPQIKDIDVRLLYSVNSQPPTDSSPACTSYSTDPKCVTQSYTSPTTIAANTTTPTTTTTTSSESLTSPLSLTPVTSSVPHVAETTPTHVVPHTTTVVASTTPTASSTTSTPPASAPAKVGEVSDSAKSAQPSASTVSLSTILSIVSSEQSRIGGVERSVVQQAVEQATKEAEKTQRDAEKIAGDSQQHSITASMQSTTTQTHAMTVGSQPTTFANNNLGAPQNQSMGAAHGAGPLPGAQGPIVSFFSSGTESGIGISAFRQEQNNAQARLTAPVVVAAVPQVSYSLLPPSRSQQLIEIDLPRAEPTRFGARPMIEEIGRSMPSLPQSSTQSNQSDTVKRNVPNNELAGAVDIASIATQPRGYAQYNVGMPDSAFYEPKEIYRNQRTVDNARVLRGLMSGSDRLHQEMVNQQYK